MRILLTNDDGSDAEGLAVLETWARAAGHQIWVVAPQNNQSGQSGALTLNNPLSVAPQGAGRWAVGGTPADCVRIATAFLGIRPDFVLSGINHGYNLGADVFASGTIGAARLAATRGIPAVAVSASGQDWTGAFKLWERHADSVIAKAFQDMGRAVISVNLPAVRGEQLVSARLGANRFEEHLQWAEFRHGRHIVGLTFHEMASASEEAGTDLYAVRHGLTSMTRLPLSTPWEHLPEAIHS